MDDETRNTSDQAASDDTEGYSMNILPKPIGTDPVEYDPTTLAGNAIGGVKDPTGEPMPFPAPQPNPSAGTAPPPKDPVNS